jgi:hypothetical protein
MNIVLSSAQRQIAAFAVVLGVTFLLGIALLLQSIIPAVCAMWLVLYMAQNYDGTKTAKVIGISIILYTVAMIVFFPGFAASAQTAVPVPNIEVDTSTLFNNINPWIALFFGILAIPAAIIIGRKIVEYVIRAVVDGF